MKTAVPEAAARGRKIALAIIDINKMREINESVGMFTGDEIIRRVAACLKDSLQPNDFLTRFGGHKFAVVMSFANQARVEETIERAMRACSEPVKLGSIQKTVSVSVGCSVFPDCSDRLEEVIALADTAAGRASLKNSTHPVFFDHSMRKDLDQRRWVESRMEDAIETGKIQPFYQPLVDLRTDTVCGFEVLARWVDDETTVFPDQFISVAEATGLVVPMTEMLISRVCDFALELGGDYTFAVNLSPVHLRTPEAAQSIINLIAAKGQSITNFEFEVTENVLIHNMEMAREFLSTLRDAGASVGLDDFGAGYSSLQYLRGLPFDKLKIDRAYINDLLSADGSSIVNAILAMAKALALKVTAEGIEDDETGDMLQFLECDRGQGWLYAKAAPAHEVPEMLCEISAWAAGRTAQAMESPIEAIDLESLPDLPEEFLEYA